MKCYNCNKEVKLRWGRNVFLRNLKELEKRRTKKEYLLEINGELNILKEEIKNKEKG